MPSTKTPLEVYREMQEAVLRDEGATLLPAELLADELVVETPFSPRGMQRWEGREAWLEFYADRQLPIRFEAFRETAVIETAVRRGRDVVYVKPIWALIMLIIRHLPEAVFKRARL